MEWVLGRQQNNIGYHRHLLKTQNGQRLVSIREGPDERELYFGWRRAEKKYRMVDNWVYKTYIGGDFPSLLGVLSQVVEGGMLTKKEAAEYLSVSSRTLERYVKDGKISVLYKTATNGEIALFHPDELAQFADDKQTPRIKPSTTDSDLATTTSDMTPSRGVGGLLATFQELTERLILALSERNEASNQLTPAMLQGKLLFTLSEAQIMTGLSREILMAAIKDGRLSSQILGKGYRIRAKDLERFIDELW